MSDDASDFWARLVANGKPQHWKRGSSSRKPRVGTKRKATAAPERDVRKVLQDAAALMGVTLLRNNVGALQDKYGRWVTYGLGLGSPDLVGWESVVIGPEHVGQTFARFVGIEAKREAGGTVSERQARYLEQLRQAGARAGVARSVEDLQAILKGKP